jgi:3-oxoacyl-[acyl-carrier-protein] synthase II
MVFPNCVANAASGHLALAFGLKGPSATLLDRESPTFVALEQAARWLRAGFCDAALVVGADGLFRMQMEVCRHAGLLLRRGDPVFGGEGFLPGEGAQAFVLERSADALARGARIRAHLGAVGSRPALEPSAEARAGALDDVLNDIAGGLPDRWIDGANGHARLDAVSARLREARASWPEPIRPKLLWGEFTGSGGQLLAAALLEPAARVLITSPSSFGAQFAARLDQVV